MKETLKSIFLGLWFFILWLAATIGISNIINHKTVSLIAICFSTGSFVFFFDLIKKEQEEKTKKIINQATTIYSLDYTNLKNIKRIQLKDDKKCYVILNKEEKEYVSNLKIESIPQNQEMLQKLDEKYNKI